MSIYTTTDTQSIQIPHILIVKRRGITLVQLSYHQVLQIILRFVSHKRNSEGKHFVVQPIFSIAAPLLTNTQAPISLITAPCLILVNVAVSISTTYVRQNGVAHMYAQTTLFVNILSKMETTKKNFIHILSDNR